MQKDNSTTKIIQAESLLPLMTDFPNKFIYYPLANLFYYPVSFTPLKPTHITLAHIVFAIIGSLLIVRGEKHDFLIAFFLFQLRAIFDCLDGTLARRKNLASELGRIIDNLGDAIGFIFLMIAFTFYLLQTGKATKWETVIVIFLSVVVTAVMAQGTDFYRRKFSYAIKEGNDIISQEISRKYHEIKNNKGGPLLYYGYANDWFQIMIFMPGSLRSLRKHIRESNTPDEYIHDVNIIREKAGTYHSKMAMFVTALMSGDNAVFIITLGLLTPYPEYALLVNIAYGLVMLISGMTIMHFFFRKNKESTHEN